MKVCILMGSPRKSGNTAALLEPFTKELEGSGISYDYIWLYDKDIKPCIACRACQNDHTAFGCVIKDDAEEIFERVYASDLIVLATPIYSWYCTAPMKALLDRLVYVMNKYYGVEIGPAIWAGKYLALVATCGYRIETATDVFETGIKRYCKHSKLKYLGMLARRQASYKDEFMDSEKTEAARKFAHFLVTETNEK